jgi:hypothetical protein
VRRMSEDLPQPMRPPGHMSEDLPQPMRPPGHMSEDLPQPMRPDPQSPHHRRMAGRVMAMAQGPTRTL